MPIPFLVPAALGWHLRKEKWNTDFFDWMDGGSLPSTNLCALFWMDTNSFFEKRLSKAIARLLGNNA